MYPFKKANAPLLYPSLGTPSLGVRFSMLLASVVQPCRVLVSRYRRRTNKFSEALWWTYSH